jgi:hypothetical protein
MPLKNLGSLYNKLYISDFNLFMNLFSTAKNLPFPLILYYINFKGLSLMYLSSMISGAEDKAHVASVPVAEDLVLRGRQGRETVL